MFCLAVSLPVFASERFRRPPKIRILHGTRTSFRDVSGTRVRLDEEIVSELALCKFCASEQEAEDKSGRKFQYRRREL